MNVKPNVEQDSPAVTELLPPPPARYLLQRALSVQLAGNNGIAEEAVPVAMSRVRLTPRPYDGITHALRIPCREFDGTYHPEAEQVVLFGNFTDAETGAQSQRKRLSAKGVPNRVGWYGNTTNPKMVVYCESRIKALVVSQAHPEWLCGGLNGVDGWSAGKDKEDRPILAANLVPPIDTHDLPAVLLPDSHHHRAVRRAMGALTVAITPHYRSVTLAELPKPTDGRDDWGADDVAAAWGVKALQGWVRENASKAADLMLESAPDIALQQPPQWIVRGWIPTDDLTLIVGETNCGKTFLTMDLLLAIARGEPQWFGYPVKASGPVVHITLEGRSLPRRLQAYAKHHNAPLPGDYYALSGNVTLPEDCDRLIRRMTQLHPVAIAIDTVNRALGGGDENSSADMGAFIRAAERMLKAFPGCAVLLVHHLGKDVERGARGHSSLKAAVGAELLIKKVGEVATVALDKQRDGETGLRLHFKLESVALDPDEDGAVSSCVVLPVAVALTVDTDPTTRDVYDWIYTYCTREHPGKLVTKEMIRKEATRIRQKGVKMTKDELVATWEAIVAEGRWVELPDTGQAANTKGAYRLLPPPERKY